MAVVKIKLVGTPFNILSINQFAEMADVSRMTVQNLYSKIDPNNPKETLLDKCYPFPHKYIDENGDEKIKDGPIFIPMNDKAKAYLAKRNKRKS